MSQTCAYRLVGVGIVSLTLLVLAGCSGSDGSNGAPGAPGAPGASTGTLSGTVTNQMSGATVPGVNVTTDPPMSSTVSTDSTGRYTCQLAVGSYTVTYKGSNYSTHTETVSIIAGAAVTLDVAMEPTAAVVISTSVQGTAAPGNTLTATAVVSPMDGSTVTGLSWKQKSGVPVQLSSTSDATIQVGLPDLTAFKDEYFKIVDEERHALLDRNMVMGINPLDLEETGAVVLTATAQTSSGTYSTDLTIAAALPFVVSAGLRNVPVGLAVLVHGKAGDSYNWSVAAPGGSQITGVEDADTQNPFFTPDVSGKYTLTESVSGASIDVIGGKWMGAIGPDGGPSSLCTTCHDGSYAPDKFTPWVQSGHAQIFSKNLNAGGHYSPSCFPCHTVGYNTQVDNLGFDDAVGYSDFLNEFFPGGHAPTPNPNNWINMVAEYPAVAKLANIQCENCHGPNDSQAHKNTQGDARVNISSDVCGACHGEPPRHGRFQQWQRSPHANSQLAIDEGTSNSCARCHAGQGFLQWITQADMTQPLLGPGGKPATADELAAMGLTPEQIQPQTCATCHDPHAQGNGGSNATVRIEGNTALLPSGYAAEGVGKGALCITCHNTRNGLHNSDPSGNYLPSKSSSPYRAPHTAAQGDVLMSQNAYFVPVGARSGHSFIADTCVTCHMVLSPPPSDLSLPGNGTNHQFNASLSICTDCHGEFDGGTLQATVETTLENLAAAMQNYLMQKITAAGTITIIDQTSDVSDPIAVPSSNIASVGAPTEVHGQQGFIVLFNTPVTFNYPNATPPHTSTLTQATVRLADFRGSDGQTALIATTDPLIQAGWNYYLIHSDGSKGVHNPSFVIDALNAAINAL